MEQNQINDESKLNPAEQSKGADQPLLCDVDWLERMYGDKEEILPEVEYRLLKQVFECAFNSSMARHDPKFREHCGSHESHLDTLDKAIKQYCDWLSDNEGD